MRHPIMVAVGGDSGTGKAALCDGLRRVLGDERCTDVRLDGYFALNRFQRNTIGLSPLDPRTHDFSAMHEDLHRLSRGEAIVKPVYDSVMGAIAGSAAVVPLEIVLVQGRFPLLTSVLRSLFDVRVWLERDANLVLPWTVYRDAIERPGDDERFRKAIERRRADYQTYIAPQAAHADIHVRFTGDGATYARDGVAVSPESARVPADIPPPLARAIALVAERVESVARNRGKVVAAGNRG